MRKFINLVFIIQLLFTNYSCVDKIEYSYYTHLNNYMNSFFNIDLSHNKNSIYLYFPVNECLNCAQTDLNLTALEKINLPENLKIIFIGEATNSNYKKRIDYIKSKHINILHDYKGEIYNYQTGILKPILLHIIDDKVVFYLNIDDDKIEDVKSYIIDNGII